MKVIISGATGMVGQGVLGDDLLNDKISSLLTLGQSVTGGREPKTLRIRAYGLSG